jgi:hypothetical protein
MVPLLAYFDPGAGSIVLQALVGGAAGLWVALRYWWSVPGIKRRGRPRRAQAHRPAATRAD